jgi:hypothetical protein
VTDAPSGSVTPSGTTTPPRTRAEYRRDIRPSVPLCGLPCTLEACRPVPRLRAPRPARSVERLWSSRMHRG